MPHVLPPPRLRQNQREFRRKNGPASSSQQVTPPLHHIEKPPRPLAQLTARMHRNLRLCHCHRQSNRLVHLSHRSPPKPHESWSPWSRSKKSPHPSYRQGTSGARLTERHSHYRSTTRRVGPAPARAPPLARNWCSAARCEKANLAQVDRLSPNLYPPQSNPKYQTA